MSRGSVLWLIVKLEAQNDRDHSEKTFKLRVIEFKLEANVVVE